MPWELWLAFKSLSHDEKGNFFDVDVLVAETIPSFFKDVDEVHVNIHFKIIERVIKPFFVPDDLDAGLHN